MRYDDLVQEKPAKTESTTVARTGDEPEFDALQTVITALQPLNVEARQRILTAVATFLQVPFPAAPDVPNESAVSQRTPDRERPAYSDNAVMSPKDFLIEKQPQTDVERIACLAFYLTHYEDMASFKTLDLSKLNTRAAQPKFTNTAQATKNAVASRYLVPSTAGYRQLGAAGEQFVHALPDRDTAKLAMAAAKPKRRVRRPKSATNNPKG